MNRKIILSGLSIVSSLALVSGSAFAAFNTTATATGSTFSSGNNNLLISSDSINFLNTISSPFQGTKITPGYTKSFNFSLKNDNTNSTDDLNVTASFKNGTGDSGLEGVLSTQFSCTDSNGATTPSAFSVASMLTGSVALGKINSGETATCTLTVSLPASADNTVAGKTTSFDVEFDATP